MKCEVEARRPSLHPSSFRLPPSSFRLLLRRPRAGVEAAHARLVDDADVEVVGDVHLARQAHVLGQPGLRREAVALGLPHLAGVAAQNLNAAGRAATRFREPTWDELRGLSADERRAILEYFKRINAERP